MKEREFDQSLWQKGLHLWTLFTIAVAHPLLDLTARNPAFYVARKSEPLDLAFLVVSLCLLLPGVLLLFVWLLGHRKITGRMFYGMILFLLCIAIILPALKKTGMTSGSMILAALLAGGIVIFTYFRFGNARSSITFLCPVVVVVPLLFLIHPRINSLLRPSRDRVGQVSIHARNPIVMVIFDEFPLKSLLDENGDIDAARFPNFYKLSRKATWYRNARTVAPDTIQSIPAILTGNYPSPTLLPNRTDYPRNLLSLLESTYELRADEFVTEFSPKKGPKTREPFLEKTTLLFADLSAIYLHHVLPPNQTGRLPVITQTWGHFWEQRQPRPGMRQRASIIDQRARKFRRFIASINKSSTPRFYFLHTMLPHVPWQYFPSGTQYNSNGIGYFGVDGLTQFETWIKDQAPRKHAFKRHLLQVAFVDRLVGELIARLEREKLFHRTLLVIVADHGTSFHDGKRRIVTKDNSEDILRIPLFIKAPGQKQGIVTDIDARTVDVMPTIQKILEIDCDWKSDGRSLLNAREIKQQKQVVPTASKLRGFDETDPTKMAIAAHPEWLGKNLTELPYGGDSPIQVHLHNSGAFLDVKTDSGFVPALVTAHMQDQRIEKNAAFGIVINGVLRATARPFQFGGKLQFLSSVVPESSFQNGFNNVEIILFSENGETQFLRPRLIKDEGQPVLNYSGNPH